MSAVSPQPAALTAAGGTITLSAAVANANECTFSSTPPLVGLPLTVPCSTGQIDQALTVPANTGTEPSSYSFELSATNSEGGSAEATPVVVALGFVSHPKNPSTYKGSPDSELNGISCTANNACIAVGDYQIGRSPEHPLIESFNGSGWTQEVTPSQKSEGSLGAISCPNEGFCMAVGSYDDTKANNEEPLAYSYSKGRWSSSPTKIVGSASDNENDLYGVWCLSSSWCMAVGRTNASVESTLTEVFTGSKWSVIPSPNVSGSNFDTDDLLTAVSCTTSNSCVAVGDDSGSNQPALIEDYDGGSGWTIAQSPSLGNPQTSAQMALAGVSCLSAPTECVAAGFNDITGAGLVEVDQGNGWAAGSTPGFDDFSSVACTAKTLSCNVVGWDYVDSNGADVVTAWTQFGGSVWTPLDSANPGDGEDALHAVSCVGTTFCMAVGRGDSAKGLVTIGESLG